MSRLLLAILLLITSVLQHRAAATEPCRTDSTKLESNYSFNARQLIVPGALTVAGIAGINAFPGFRKSINNNIGTTHHWSGDDYLRFIPSAAYLTLGLCGVKGRNSFRDRMLAAATAHLSMGIIVVATKNIVKEERPDFSGNNSFPSGHVATAFTGAELMRIEYGNVIGAAGYAVATGVGFLRLYNNRHWYNDILAGAGIGILCARVGYWLLPFEKELFGFKDTQKYAVIAPFYQHYGKAGGVSFSLNF